MEKGVIETSFAKESGYGNAVYSKMGTQKNADYITQLFGPKKAFDESANDSPFNPDGTTNVNYKPKNIKPKGTNKEFESVALPNYIRKQREKAMVGKDNFFDKVITKMENQGEQDITGFLGKLKQKEEEAKQARLQREQADGTPELKKEPVRTGNSSVVSPRDNPNGKKINYDKHGKPIPYWKPILTLPSEKYANDFIDKGESNAKASAVFRSRTREHVHQQDFQHQVGDDFMSADKYNPRTRMSKPNATKMITFSPNQLERRTFYFEGDPAVLVHTQNRFNMLQTVREQRAI